MKAYVRKSKRIRYSKTCECPKTPQIITPPPVDKAIPKGKFGDSFWAYILLHKFYLHTPLNRIIKSLKFQYLEVSAGTIAGGVENISKLFLPVYQEIEIRNKSEHHWHADETRWMVFEKIEKKTGYRWYLWVFKSETTVFIKMAPTRGQVVVQEHFATSFGILSVDRYVGYKVLLSTGNFLLAFCWTHLRRDFVEIEKSEKSFAAWAAGWVKRIGEIYHINNERIAHNDESSEFKSSQVKLEHSIFVFKAQVDADLLESITEVSSTRRKVLTSLLNHWYGFILFVKYHWLPMDNNPAERQVRGPVIGRKGYYGSGSSNSAQMAAYTFSINGTLDLWKINVNLWTTEYLQACAKNGGKAPEKLDDFLPWKMSEERLAHFGCTEKPKTYAKITQKEIACATVDDFFVKKKSTSSEKSSPPRKIKVEEVSQNKYVKDCPGANPMAA